MSVEEGKKAPDFTLQDSDGEKVSLRGFAGKNVILYFYPKDHTSGCTKEACCFRDVWADIRAHNAVILGVSPDTPESHKRFAADYELPFILLSDPQKKVLAAYGAYGEKVLYGKRSTGVIRSTVWIGPDGRIKKHWKRIAKAAEHPHDVLEALEREGEASPRGLSRRKRESEAAARRTS